MQENYKWQKSQLVCTVWILFVPSVWSYVCYTHEYMLRFLHVVWMNISLCYRIFISKLKSLILCRLHIFGRDSTIRPGWLTVGPELTNSNFNAELYASYFTNGQATTGCTERIEALRPKSPPPKGKGAPGGRGRGGPSRGGFSRGRGRGR